MDFRPFLLLLLAIATLTTAINHQTPLAHTPTSPPTAPPLQQQLDKITDALIGAEDFAGWANILSSSADPSTLPMTATLFIPSNDAISRLPPASSDHPSGGFGDSFLIPYHIVPQRLTFKDLQRFSIGTRLPTLLPGKFIVVTDNSVGNFSVDGSRVTHPDLFVTGTFSVHGVMDVLDYSVFGGGSEVCPHPPANLNVTVVESKPKPEPEPIGSTSSATGLLLEFWQIASCAVCSFLVFKILSWSN